jgi:hypothetical protein
MKRIWLGLWLGLLGATVLAASGRAIQDASNQPEFVAGCDSFGYLSMTRALRQAWASGHWPAFELASAQSDALVRDLSGSGLPLGSWDHLVGPHAYHYLESSGKTVPQYPPGTALLTAPFREGNAVFSLTRIDVLLAALSALVVLCLAGLRGSWVSAGWVTLVAVFAIRLPAAVGDRSFSVQALLVPCGLGAAFAARAWVLGGRGERKAALLAAVSGALLGLSILCRLPCVFVLPGLLVPFLFLGRRGLAPAVALLAGVFLFGFIPLFVHQAVLTGHFYLPTYSMAVVSPRPSLASFQSGIFYYLGKGEGAGFNWVLVTLLVSVPAGLALGVFPRGRDLGILGAGALLAWAVPTAYFLPYQVQEPYYLAAGTLAAVAFFAAGACLLEDRVASPGGVGASHTRLRPAVLAWAALAAWPALSIIPGAFREAALPTRWETPPVRLTIPDELRDPGAWVWADYYSGTITYFGGHAAFKLPFSTRESRLRAFALARASSGFQYLVEDSAAMPALMEELRQSGAELVLRGTVEPYRYYRVTWPALTPRPASLPASGGTPRAPG